MKITSQRCLILNADFSPLTICTATRALLMLLDDKADTVVESKTEVHSQSASFVLPSIVRLRRYVNVPHAHTRSIPLTTRTVMARDQHRCAYCGGHATTIDHVQPRAKGGKHIWENCVAACRPCNSRKADRTPEQARMPLLFQPSRPKGAHARLLLYSVEDAWRPYLLTEVSA